jgi:hypothetical protein
MFTGVLTTAGTLLGGQFVFKFLKTSFPKFSFSGANLSWSQYFSFWSFALAEEPGVGGVTLLCLLTTPLTFALLGYNTYLLYRGMTTNETGKWKDFQAEVDDGYVIRRSLPQSRRGDETQGATLIGWPKKPVKTYVTIDAQRVGDVSLPTEGVWESNLTLGDVDNIYDIGFVGTVLDVFLPRGYLVSWMRTRSGVFS